MDSETIGVVLLAPGSGGLSTYYSPWLATNGNLVYFQCDVIQTDGLGGFSIEVQTKNSEDSDSVPNGSSALATQAITLTAGLPPTEVAAGANLGSTSAGLKELVRLVYKVTGGANYGGFVHFRILNASWLTN